MLLNYRNYFYLQIPLSREIQEAGKENKNKKESIRTLLSGKILKEYRVLQNAAIKTSTGRRKLSKVNIKVMSSIRTKKDLNQSSMRKSWTLTFEMMF